MTLFLFSNKIGFARLTGISLHECAKQEVKNVHQTIQIANLPPDKIAQENKIEKPKTSNNVEVAIELPVQSKEIVKEIILPLDNVHNSNDIIHLVSQEDLTVVQVEWILGENNTTIEVLKSEEIVSESTEDNVGKYIIQIYLYSIIIFEFFTVEIAGKVTSLTVLKPYLTAFL